MNSDKDKLKLLEGFESIFDLMDESIDDEGKKIGKITDDRHEDNYELYNFLETELARLTRIHSLLTQKLDNLSQYSQSQQLAEKQLLQIKRAKTELAKKFSHPDSQALCELGLLWDGAFGSNDKN
jgi:hypothetical protein